jgi:hypothetical protein
VLLILYAIWCCAISWPKIALRRHKGDKADKNQLADHWWGFKDPDLIWDQEGSLSHRAIDFLVEWVRSNQQRAAKLGSFVIVVLLAFGVVGWLI